MNQQLINFYSGAGKDDRGRTLHEILAWSDDRWERSHDMIQWVFPLPEPSKHNAHAPLLDDETLRVFGSDVGIKANTTLALKRARLFFGYDDDLNTDVRPSWFTRNNHNHLRLTRILRFLRLTNRIADATWLQQWLLRLAKAYPNGVTESTIDFWIGALADTEDAL